MHLRTAFRRGLVLTSIVVLFILTLPLLHVSRGQNVNAAENALKIENHNGTNALDITQLTSVGTSRSQSGAIFLDNSGNLNTGLTLYSDQKSPRQPLMRLEIDNPEWNEEILYIHSDSPTSRGLIRLDSPAPEIEMVETDQDGNGAGKFEIRVQHDQFQINSRNREDTSFETAFSFYPLREGAKLGIGDRYPDAHLEVTRTGDEPFMMLSSSPHADGDVMSIDEAGSLEIKKGAFTVSSGEPATFDGGINITGGCLAVNGRCVDLSLTGDATLEPNLEPLGTEPLSAENIDAFNALHEYRVMDVERDAPPKIDCNSYTEMGRYVLREGNNRMYVCNGPERGWDYINLND